MTRRHAEKFEKKKSAYIFEKTKKNKN